MQFKANSIGKKLHFLILLETVWIEMF